MKPEILPTETRAQFEKAARRAVDLLQAGELVALPTETVYGLAANAWNPDAVAKIFQVKSRPANNPLIVHVCSGQMAKRCAAEWPPLAEKMARSFWPGPLTLVLPRAPSIPDIVTASGPTVGIRWPSHPLIQEVIRLCGFPLAAPSANKSTALSPTTAEHVRRSLGNEIPLIVDGGRSQVGIESTVLDLSVNPPAVLRPGMIHRPSLEAVAECPIVFASDSPERLKSPGQLLKHYSPRAKLVVWNWDHEAELIERLRNTKVPMDECHVIAHRRIPIQAKLPNLSIIPHDAEAFARALYAELHRCDEAGARLIVVEALAEGAEWDGLRDRLRRAGG